MEVYDTKIEGLKIIHPKVFADERGYFLEAYNWKAYLEVTGGLSFVQDNHSCSYEGVLRGLHFQKSNPQGKLVRCTRGGVWDVAVDLRENSPTFGEWEGVYLSETNHKQFYIPPGFAHGFYTLSDMAEFQYKCTNYYDPSSEETIIWNDDTLGIHWGLSKEPLVSEKDKKGKTFKELFDV